MLGKLPRRAGRPRARSLALMCTLCVLSGLGGAGTDAAEGAPLGGVNILGIDTGVRGGEIDRAIARAKSLHAELVRVALNWAYVEPRAAGQLDPGALAMTDRLVSDASAAGIRVIFTVDGSPCWASSAPATTLGKCSIEHRTPATAWPPVNAGDYAAFVGTLAARYGTKLGAIEIWNEPDQANQLYLAGPNKAQRYARLLRAAYPAIKQANPNVPVIAGSLVGYNGVFLRSLYAAGIKGYYDALAVHFYSLTLASLRQFREVQLANGDSKPLWLDEFGWTTCRPLSHSQDEQPCVTPQTQAADLGDIYRSLARTSWVAAVVSFQLQDTIGTNFGVLTSRGARKPAYGTLSSVLASPLSGRVARTTVRLRRAGGHVLASGSGPVGDYMRLEAFVRGNLRYRATFTLNRFNSYTLPIPAVLGTSMKVRVFQLWAGPGQDSQTSI
ncbi:MAG TPA: cellulase family glycosylhydrolase, partial [Solirubrobacteraceae bacterium]|nr:cellulase family glycosylhydrolase [Solirubrobacteraceae bacterium]